MHTGTPSHPGRQQLPAAAQRYVQMLEEAVGCRVRYISVGPAREACLVRGC